MGYVRGAVRVVGGALLGDPAGFLLGLVALAVALVVRGEGVNGGCRATAQVLHAPAHLKTRRTGTRERARLAGRCRRAAGRTVHRPLWRSSMDPRVYCQETPHDLPAKHVCGGWDPNTGQRAVVLSYLLERQLPALDFEHQLEELSVSTRHGQPGVAAAAQVILADWRERARGAAARPSPDALESREAGGPLRGVTSGAAGR